MQAQDEPLDQGQVCGTVIMNAPFEPKILHMFENQLLIAGFGVKSA
jgi:hypothetical protein